MMDKKVQKDSYYQLTLPLEQCPNQTLKCTAIEKNAASSSSNVVELFAAVSSKQKNDMAAFQERVFRSVTAYFDL